MLLTVAKGLVSLAMLCLGVHLIRKAKRNRTMDGNKPKEPVWWKQMERWQEDPELLGLFLAVIASGGILQTLWRFAQMALRFFSEK
jgi:hypothetical protein